jgi:hypothetical protein
MVVAEERLETEERQAALNIANRLHVELRKSSLQFENLESVISPPTAIEGDGVGNWWGTRLTRPYSLLDEEIGTCPRVTSSNVFLRRRTRLVR